MERVEFKVFGRVQGVNFRFSVAEASRNFKVKGFAQNLLTGEVLVVAEGKREELEGFLETVKNFSFTEITKVEVEWKKFKNEFTEFKVKY